MGANSDYPCFFPVEVRFFWSVTLKSKPALPHHTEKTEYFISLHITVLLIVPKAELPFFPNFMSWAATHAIPLVLETWPRSPVKAGILCAAIAGEDGSVMVRGMGWGGEGGNRDAGGAQPFQFFLLSPHKPAVLHIGHSKNILRTSLSC